MPSGGEPGARIEPQASVARAAGHPIAARDDRRADDVAAREGLRPIVAAEGAADRRQSRPVELRQRGARSGMDRDPLADDPARRLPAPCIEWLGHR
jgi:hypothetical protein